MSARYPDGRPSYPLYESQPMFGGSLPTIDQIGPPDMRPSALNPFYDIYRGAWGRSFAGLGASMDSADPGYRKGIRDYPSELNILAAADDVQGNGVFDPPGTHGNVHADQGVFADHESLPGYIVRDRFYEPSQVIDGTTGEPVLYVPAGAVAIDQSQKDTIEERIKLWELPPGVSPEPVTAPSVADTWIPEEYAWPVSGLGEDALVAPSPPGQATTGQLIAACAIIGTAVGLFAAVVMKR